MENKNNFSESIIYTGSDMNHRTFREDESWNSLQSTILAGHFSMSSDSEIPDKKNLTTLNEELSKEALEFISVEEDENMLNINLDAISDDVFFDCQNVSSSQILIEPNSSLKAGTHAKIQHISSNKQHLMVHSPKSVNTGSTSDSGVEEEKTGALLVQIVEDFKDMKGHAQSTPKLTPETKHLSPITSASKNLTKLMNCINGSLANTAATSLKTMTNVNSDMKNCTSKRALNFLPKKTVKRVRSPHNRQYSPVDRINKENFFAGKCSSGLNIVSKANPNLPSPLEKKPRRVAQIKEFFENQSKICDQTHNKKIDSKSSVKKSGLKSTLHSYTSQMRSARSPSYHTQETFKLLKTSKAFKTNTRNIVNSSNSTSFLLRNQTQNTNRSRPSSCSEFIAESTANRLLAKNTLISTSSANKSKSTSSLSNESVKYIKLLQARELKMITSRPYLSVNKTLNPKSPTSLKVSDIMKRKSLGYVSSPVKPVKELRKIFSPSRDMKVKDQIKERFNRKTRGLQIIISKE